MYSQYFFRFSGKIVIILKSHIIFPAEANQFHVLSFNSHERYPFYNIFQIPHIFFERVIKP